MVTSSAKLVPALSACLLMTAAAELPPVPVPAENPITETKRVLGKILFWDEQLSSDNTVACGTCHRPAAGGADPRVGKHPGTDPGTIDDVQGSQGIVSLDRHGRPTEHPLFGFDRQVTARTSLSNFGALWADEAFWDGSAAGEFRDPLTGRVAIATGGALEIQALTALANDAEMAKHGRTWQELTAKLARTTPLDVASDLPDDVAAAIRDRPGYPELFAAAFGDPAITPVRIAFAIASYERTLLPDQTPWDRYRAGDLDAMNELELYGWQAMQDFQCVKCHEPPLFTNNDYFNIGLRRAEYDLGRQAVTGDPEDAGEVRVPSLRNVGLKPRFMHTGEFQTLSAAVSFYRTGAVLAERDRIPGGGTYAFNMSTVTEGDIHAFLKNALTDRRVHAELFPFDRPTLRSERHGADTLAPVAPRDLRAKLEGTSLKLSWRAPADNTGIVDYVLHRNGGVIALLTDTSFVDAHAPLGAAVTYDVLARDAARNESPPARLTIR
ncbi:cytochrome c peroxidase [Candidatus Rariloculus sp.]|uniref:cytochrome-c peroxidase n=1 Tax=Candidatus Rariloculus sp. TaxID=3101265 RepID=UPI003D0B7B2C